MGKKLQEILNKKNFNYSEGYIDPLQFHSTLYFIMKCYGLLDEEFPTTCSRFVLAFLLCCAIPAFILSVMAFLHGCQILDVTKIIEAGAYVIVLSYKLLILSCTKLYLRQFHSFLRILRADFEYVTVDGSKYRDKFFENQLQSWKICIVFIIAMSSIAIGMVLMATLVLIYFVLTNESGSGGQRPLLFPFWFFEIDFSKSPTYEIAFVFANVCILAHCYNYICIIVIQILWVREIATKADFVIWSINDLMEGIYPTKNEREAEIFSNSIKRRMRAIIQQHQSMYELTENYCQVYKKLLIFELLFCGPVVCLTAYSATEKLEYGEVNFVLFLLCIAAIIVAFVPSYLCTYVRIKVTSVVDACWDTPFWNAGPVIRPYLVLIIQRTLRPLPLRFGGFQEVSVQTFSNKMASAYSCFNMLRQAFK